jgi:hypothetical protein
MEINTKKYQFSIHFLQCTIFLGEQTCPKYILLAHIVIHTHKQASHDESLNI